MKRVRWWDWLPIFGWRVVMTCDAADEVPDKLPRNGAALVASGTVAKWLVFDCACRTGHRIMLPLQGAPRWQVVGQRPLTVAPSVDYRGHRRCHYVLRDGSVRWV